MRLTMVLLPEPDGPIIATHSPGAIERETSSSALMRPRRRLFFAGGVTPGYGLELESWSAPLLSSQDNSWLHAPQHANRNDSRNQGYGHTSGKHIRKDAEARHHRRVEIDAPDQRGNSDADEEPSMAPAAPSTAASAAKNAPIKRSEAPSAFMIAKSRRRSSTQPISVASTHNAAVSTTSVAAT